MSAPNMLFISWQGGMGHVTRDLAIAQELRKIELGGAHIPDAYPEDNEWVSGSFRKQ